ncbi:hypothetical protein OROGR_011357 [Orobanche gracilis]
MVMMADETLIKELPTGYRFSPTDLELIAYLFFRMLGLCLLGQVIKDIHEKKFYADHPGDVVKDKEEEREWYFCIHSDKHNRKEQDLRIYEVGVFRSLVFGGNKAFFRKLEDLIKRIFRDVYEEDEQQQLCRNRMVKKPHKHDRLEHETNNVRDVGNGMGIWKSVGKKDPIYDSQGNTFAFKAHYVYYKRFRNKYKRTHWRMEEYNLTTERRNYQKGWKK